MSLLDDARRINDAGPPEYGEICCLCQSVLSQSGHAPDCPWLAMPAIIAALEAAERIVSVWQEMRDRNERRSDASWYEVSRLPTAAALTPDEQAARQALVAALRGDQ